jgi:hypothetical protein
MTIYMNIILILLIVILIMFFIKIFYNLPEPFADPYSICLHHDISEKEDWWNKTHSKKLYYYYNYVPQQYKE